MTDLRDRAGRDESVTASRSYPRSHPCLITEDLVGKEISVNGWVDTIRDHGGITFIDLRDRTGIVQVVVEIGQSDLSTLSRSLRPETVVNFAGTVDWRPKDRADPERPTGLLELDATSLEVLNRAEGLQLRPTDPNWERTNEQIRLRHRSVALRSPKLQHTLRLRHRLLQSFRNELSGKHLIEVETPMLTKSTPEGARDFLVPSRLSPGMFYSLPQSPQLFKQILMIGGLGGYFQVARCFRDEDLKADRQPEFTQLDLELSFVGEEDVIGLVEEMVRNSILNLAEQGLIEQKRADSMQSPFPRIGYAEAMQRYATDAPDIRFELPIVDITDIAAETEVKIFRDVVAKGGTVRVINARGAERKTEHFSKRELNELISFAQQHGAQGMAWMAMRADGNIASPITKFFSEEQLDALIERCEAQTGDIIFFIADQEEMALRVLNPVRRELGRRLGLIDEDELAFVWVEQFPLMNYSEEEGRLVANHHPFTSPDAAGRELIEEVVANGSVAEQREELLRVGARAYDLVLNGVEIGGGSIRIHEAKLQRAIFDVIGIDAAQAEERFGFLLDALNCGAPPHGGLALGVDRIVMLLAKAKSLREVIAFPKLGDGSDPLTEAPSYVDPEQLLELGFDVELEED